MTDRAIPITVVVSTKNEERAISACLEGVKQFSQVYVVDSQSTDSTKELAASKGAVVVDFQWDGLYPKKKQWCLDNLTIDNAWLLFLDADETPSAELVHELVQIGGASNPPNIVAYDIPLTYVFGGRRLLHGHVVTKRALLRPDKVHFPVVDDLDAPGMGELEGHYQPVAEGQVASTAGRIIHDDPDPIASWIARHNKYSDWEAFLRFHSTSGGRVNAVRSKQGRIFARIPGKPLAFFIYSFILRRGFIDGRAGFDYAFGLAWYYWLIDTKHRELLRSSQGA